MEKYMDAKRKPAIRLSTDDMVTAGVEQSAARQHRVTDGCSGVPVGAWVGVDSDDQTVTDGELYLIYRDRAHQVRYLWRAGQTFKIGRSPRTPSATVPADQVAVLGRVFWVGFIRPRPKTDLEPAGTTD